MADNTGRKIADGVAATTGPKKSRRGRKAQTADKVAEAVAVAVKAQADEDLTDGRLPSDRGHPLFSKKLSYEIQPANKLVVCHLWYPFEPVEKDESFTLDEITKKEAALDASDSAYAKWRYARHLEVQSIARDQMVDMGLIAGE